MASAARRGDAVDEPFGGEPPFSWEAARCVRLRSGEAPSCVDSFGGVTRGSRPLGGLAIVPGLAARLAGSETLLPFGSLSLEIFAAGKRSSFGNSAITEVFRTRGELSWSSSCLLA